MIIKQLFNKFFKILLTLYFSSLFLSNNQASACSFNLKDKFQIDTEFRGRIIREFMDGQAIYIIYVKNYTSSNRRVRENYVAKIDIKSRKTIKHFIGNGDIFSRDKEIFDLINDRLYVSTVKGVYLFDKNLQRLDLWNHFSLRPAIIYSYGSMLYPYTSLSILVDNKTGKRYFIFIKPKKGYNKRTIGGDQIALSREKILWEKELYSLNDGVLTHKYISNNPFKPVLYNNVLFFFDSKKTYGGIVGNIEKIYRYDLMNGKLKETSMDAYYNPIFIMKNKILTIGSGVISCFDLKDEKRLWILKLKDINLEGRILYNVNNIIFVSDRIILSIDGENGNLLWRFGIPDNDEIGRINIVGSPEGYLFSAKKRNEQFLKFYINFYKKNQGSTIWKKRRNYIINLTDGRAIFQEEFGSFFDSSGRDFVLWDFNEKNGLITLRRYTYEP